MNDTGPIEAALAAWQTEQRLRGGCTQIELDELTDHLRSSAAGLAPTAAERVQLAIQRIGAGAELAQEYDRVRGVRLAALAFSPAGLLTAGALLWGIAEHLITATKLGVATASLWLFPNAMRGASLVGSIVSLGVVALLAMLLASERRTRSIGEQLRVRPGRMLGAYLGCAFVAIGAHSLAQRNLLRVADTTTAQFAKLDYIAFLPPLLLFIVSIRAARRPATSAALRVASEVAHHVSHLEAGGVRAVHGDREGQPLRSARESNEAEVT